MEREAERIECVGDDGNKHTIIVYQSYVDGGTIERPVAWVSSTKRGTLEDGRPINRIDADTFEIVETGEIIRRVK